MKRLALLLSALFVPCLVAAAPATQPATQPAAAERPRPVAYAAGHRVRPLPAAYRQALEAGQSLALPEGAWTVDRTITLPNKSGQRLAGAGCLPCSPLTTGHWGGSTLLWAGAPGGTMIAAPGATNLRVEDLTLVGRASRDGDNRAGILLHAGGMAGFGTAYWSLSRVTFVDAGAGFQAGTGEWDACCSDMSLVDCVWWACDDAYRSVNHQAVNVRFTSPRVFACGTGWNLVRGGNVVVDGAGAFQGTGWLLRSGDGGHNVRQISVSNLRVEGDVRVQLGAFRTLVLSDVQMSEPIGEYRADVDETSRLEVRGGQFFGR